ncbi:hypothetical protein SOVF_142240 [Spinacia oleracea]|nr:hypothetical protein SOVF_142240 [Spinacia oleracea]
MKAELRKQFLPNNTSWVARDKLKDLKHSNTIREYVKQLMSLMLDITNMSEEDKLFQFMSGLKPWAQTKLGRQKVEDLNSSIVAAEALIDWKINSSSDGKGKGKEVDRDHGKKRKFNKKKNHQNSGKKSDSQRYEKKGDPSSSNKRAHFNKGCFICKGPHIARNFPKRQQLSTLLAEKEDVVESPEPLDIVPRMNTMKLLNAMNADHQEPVDGLMYCKVGVNGKEILAMIDTGATHNFIKDGAAKKLGL